ncbi:LTA synthase family protein [Dawidia soli]|uniref:LTA synthase family protein n=1 Tax=Dawidia soli TaxID=2782352 RepID=A0AAP2D4M5_9BACT|nr:LTA synthase family protein [Dawidia soli]MBT1684959.1 LTA synthase family protein [Dawidia soli]
MNLQLTHVKSNRSGLILLLFFLLIGISVFTRLLLAVKVSAQVDFSFMNDLEIAFIGLLYDFVNAIYFAMPLVLYLWLVPQRVYARPGHVYVLYGWFFVLTYILLFNGVAEWLFWDEFNARFNFIAVDYLVYTTEVIGNINQSYPMGWIMAGTIVATTAIVLLFKSWIECSQGQYVPFKKRALYFALYTAVFSMSLLTVTTKLHHFSKNAFVNELAGNGMYELFAAYRHNELDYDRFYACMDTDEAFRIVRKDLKTPEAQFLSSDPHSIVRAIRNAGPEKKWNVVLVSVESFSADFMGKFGNKDGVTPFLDSLAGHSLLFTNLYATGTRTVRGLEALSLCVPPTPGQSVVRRPNNEALFSLGHVFNEKGYTSQFIYGGYSYFDNMGYFFGNNGYNVIDRSALKGEEIDYENIWGVADENLFTLALRKIDAQGPGKKVFSHIMTTSNHRPYTYPEGRIDIPSHTSRNGAVKYTDYAIGKFIREASRKPWFNNTVFVIVADHCASSAGKTELPVDKYHIPMLIYSPGNIMPGTMDRLMSQIDIGPTLLGLLNFSYTSNFFGYDMYQLEPGRERAFISTYQNLGYIHDGRLVILSPQAKVETFRLTPDNESIPTTGDHKHVREAIAWYQAASDSFTDGHMKANARNPLP